LSSSSSSCCVLCLCACILSAILALTSSGMASWGCWSCGLGFEGLGALGVGWFWMLPAGESWEGSASLSFEDGVRWESEGRFWGCCRSGCQYFNRIEKWGVRAHTFLSEGEGPCAYVLKLVAGAVVEDWTKRLGRPRVNEERIVLRILIDQ
jgi:hypothetical protein